MSKLLKGNTSEFLNCSTVSNAKMNATTVEFPKERIKCTVSEIVKIHSKMSSLRTNENLWKGKEVEVSDATGTVKSVREWSKAAFGADKKQQRAFEVLIASFSLTFHKEKKEDWIDPVQQGKDQCAHQQMKKASLKLRGWHFKKDVNLICLLHGPGGSGKSAVIDAVKAHASNCCRTLGHPFASRTIIVTAMSGVAAMPLRGENNTHGLRPKSGCGST